MDTLPEYPMTLPTLRVLLPFVMSPDAALTGPDVHQQTGVGSSGVYMILVRLERHGWLRSRVVTGDRRPPRKLYSITDEGLDAVMAALTPFARVMEKCHGRSVCKAASVCLLDRLRKGLVSKDAAFRAMQGIADQLGEPGESSHQRFNKAFGSRDRNRVPGGDALQRELNKLGQEFNAMFNFTPQSGDEDPAASVRRVTVRSDDGPRTNSQFQPYSYTSEPRVISPTNSTALDTFQAAIREIMRVQGVTESKAIDIAQQDPSLREKWEAAKAERLGLGDFSPLLTKKAPHGWGGQPDVPLSNELDDEDDEDDLRREGAHRRPRLRKRDLPMIAAALRKRYYGSGGGGIPR
jgi:DNA-binding PadR family transcriptional regulator